MARDLCRVDQEGCSRNSLSLSLSLSLSVYLSIYLSTLSQPKTVSPSTPTDHQLQSIARSRKLTYDSPVLSV